MPMIVLLPLLTYTLQFLNNGFLNHFFDRRDTITDLVQSRFSKRDHAKIDRFSPKFHCTRANDDELSELIRDLHYFVKPYAAFIARIVAVVAASAAIDLERRRFFLRKADLDQTFRREMYFLFTLIADPADKPL